MKQIFNVQYTSTQILQFIKQLNNIERWRKQSSGIWRRVDIVLTDVLEERIASIFRVEEEEKSASEPAWGGANRLKMEAIYSSETSVISICTRRHTPEDRFLHSHRRVNLKSYII
jgi:hypothetical protein